MRRWLPWIAAAIVLLILPHVFLVAAGVAALAFLYATLKPADKAVGLCPAASRAPARPALRPICPFSPRSGHRPLSPRLDAAHPDTPPPTPPKPQPCGRPGLVRH